MAVRRVLRSTGAAAALAGALSSDTSCFQEGKEYVDGALTEGLPNGAYVHEPYLCQRSCQAQANTLPCRGFTWRASPAAPTLLRGATGPGGCWLVGDSAVLATANLSQTPGRVVSGAVDCGLAAATTTLSFTTAPAPVAGVGFVPVTIAPLATAAPPLQASQAELTTTISLGENGTAGNVTATGGNDSPGSMLWSILGGIGVFVIFIGTVVVCLQLKDKSKKKKKKKGDKEKLKENRRKNNRDRTTRAAEVDPEDEQVHDSGAPLLVPSSPPPPSPEPYSQAYLQRQAGQPQAFPPSGPQTVLTPYGYAQPQLPQQMVFSGYHTGRPLA